MTLKVFSYIDLPLETVTETLAIIGRRGSGKTYTALRLVEEMRAGLEELGSGFEPLPTGAALREYWSRRLSAGERAVLDVVVKAHPHRVGRERVSEVTGYRRSTRDKFVARLKACRLVEANGRGEIRASDDLFDAEERA